MPKSPQWKKGQLSTKVLRAHSCLPNRQFYHHQQRLLQINQVLAADTMKCHLKRILRARKNEGRDWRAALRSNPPIASSQCCQQDRVSSQQASYDQIEKALYCQIRASRQQYRRALKSTSAVTKAILVARGRGPIRLWQEAAVPADQAVAPLLTRLDHPESFSPELNRLHHVTADAQGDSRLSFVLEQQRVQCNSAMKLG